MAKRETRDLSSDIGVIRTFKFIQNKPHFAIGEFVDNSIQSFLDHKEKLEKLIPGYKPKIEISVTNNLITVRDNCAGISMEDEERAFMVAASNPNIAGIGTFGMGMKVSACWFSDQWKVETKYIDEDEIKTFDIDVNKILESGDLTIGPKTQKSSDQPFTQITILNPFEDKLPHASGVTAIKDHLSDIYRWFINDNQIDIFYNGDQLAFDPPNIKEMPCVSDPDGESYEWVTEIPELDLGDGLKAWGVAYLRDKGRVSGQRGFGIFWKDRLVTGSTGDPWMPGSNDDFDTREAVNKYAIYQGANSGINQRLEGWIHISPEFEVPSTKNGVLWYGKDLVLMEQLKSYLTDCELIGTPNKKFDFIRQAKKGEWKKKLDIDTKKIDEAFDNEALEELKKQKTEINVDIGDISLEKADPVEEIIQNENQAPRTFIYEDTQWNIIVELVRNDEDNFYDITNGPDGDMLSTERVVKVSINLGHPFVERYFDQGEGVLEKEGILKLAISLAMAEILAKEKSAGPIGMRRIMNSLLRNPDL